MKKSNRELVPANAQAVPGMVIVWPAGNTITHPDTSH